MTLFSVTIIAIAGCRCSHVAEPVCLSNYPNLEQAKKFAVVKNDNHFQISPQDSPWNEYYVYDYKGAIFLSSGWNELKKDNLAEAMNYFNKAWLRKKDNYLVYWGYGVLSGKMGGNTDNNVAIKKYFTRSINFLIKAVELAPDEVKKTVSLDLANAYTGLSAFLIKKKKDKGIANFYLKEAEDILLKYKRKVKINGRAYYLLATCMFYQNRKAEATNFAQKAEELKFELPSDFKRKLEL